MIQIPAKTKQEIEAKFTKYEIARILGARALQLAMNAPVLVSLEKEDFEKINYDPLKIAEFEFYSAVLPITVKRPMPPRKEEKMPRKEKPVEEAKAEEKGKSEKTAEAEKAEGEKPKAKEIGEEVMEKRIIEEAKETEIMELAKPADEAEGEAAQEIEE